jgi:uncharacterized membrane protein YphA (DoxX/SURF4 family)
VGGELAAVWLVIIGALFAYAAVVLLCITPIAECTACRRSGDAAVANVSEYKPPNGAMKVVSYYVQVRSSAYSFPTVIDLW